MKYEMKLATCLNLFDFFLNELHIVYLYKNTQHIHAPFIHKGTMLVINSRLLENKLNMIPFVMF